MSKIADSDKKRKITKEKKNKLLKLNDERWHHKIEDIEKKFKEKNKEAIAKAQEYR